jgi:hypothetical protein
MAVRMDCWMIIARPRYHQHRIGYACSLQHGSPMTRHAPGCSRVRRALRLQALASVGDTSGTLRYIGGPADSRAVDH